MRASGVLSGMQDITIRFTEPIAAASVSPQTLRVVDAGAFVPGGGDPPLVPAAPGYPMLRRRGEPGTAGFEIVWRPDPSCGGLPLGTRVRVTAVGSDGGTYAPPITDVAGNPLPNSYEFEFTTRTPPNFPAAR
jgi:hypothetical protein